MSGASAFTGGFVGSSLTSLADGETVGNSLVSGFKSGIISGVTSGVLGGLSGGIQSIKHGGNFWTGEGAIFETPISSEYLESLDKSNPLEYSNEYARKFTKDNFGEIKGLNELYADGTLPNDSYRKLGDVWLNSKGQMVGGAAKFLGFGNGSNVYLSQAVFYTPESLYLSMGHEYLHVGFHTLGLFDDGRQHSPIYKWMYKQARLWNYHVDYFRNASIANYNLRPYDITKNPNWFPAVNIRPWH